MKLQSQVSRKIGDTEYTKFWVIIPQRIIRKLGWKSGQELEMEIKGNKLVIEKD
jgi:bifunctional DNA-binding transcriptional regulator/antitoxin component of YhaV-PrlF toxin-antitoxin module